MTHPFASDYAGTFELFNNAYSSATLQGRKIKQMGYKNMYQGIGSNFTAA